jgi:hypothetical protein
MTETRIRPKAKPPSTPRGGFIIARRERGSPRLKCSPAPYEHSSLAAARAEARVLTTQYGCEFVIFREIAPTASSSKREAGNA